MHAGMGADVLLALALRHEPLVARPRIVVGQVVHARRLSPPTPALSRSATVACDAWLPPAVAHQRDVDEPVLPQTPRGILQDLLEHPRAAS